MPTKCPLSFVTIPNCRLSKGEQQEAEVTVASTGGQPRYSRSQIQYMQNLPNEFAENNVK